MRKDANHFFQPAKRLLADKEEIRNGRLQRWGRRNRLINIAITGGYDLMSGMSAFFLQPLCHVAHRGFIAFLKSVRLYITYLFSSVRQSPYRLRIHAQSRRKIRRPMRAVIDRRNEQGRQFLFMHASGMQPALLFFIHENKENGMKIFNGICKSTLVATSLALAFGTAYANPEAVPMQLAQAQTGQSGAYGSSSTGTDKSGQAGTSSEGGTSGQSGTSSQGGSSQPEIFVHPPIVVQGQEGTSSQSGAADQGGTSGASGQAGQGRTAQSRIVVTPPVYVIMTPETAANDSAVKSGCWVRIYDRENFLGDRLTLTGPISLADMSGPFGLNWDDRVNSIETGPKAMVSVYDNPGYVDPVAQLKPGQRIADINKRTGLFDEFASIKVDCQKA